MAEKRHDQITRGDVVKGSDGGWWKVTGVDVQRDGFRQFRVVSIQTGNAGYLSGPANEQRQVR
jgi:hypothetical protein